MRYFFFFKDLYFWAFYAPADRGGRWVELEMGESAGERHVGKESQARPKLGRPCIWGETQPPGHLGPCHEID